ncbi:hypothetical protein Glove_423g45 [Diversispora epigaea]|uniref:Uncharacterized protein n=1 Tax=Diversispora epigaea TaxID=1348612 RepID=A0A397H2V0_9GLOM|nr:hypothetical protein Glove_423g45 [Diversispora epigaea]
METIKSINIKLSTEAIGIIIASFLTIRQVQVNDKIISSQIQKINDQHAKFITFCRDTKSLSNALVNYSNDILSTVKVIEEKNFKGEDLVDFLNSLLSAARENKTKSENYESQINQIQNNLEGIIEELFKYRDEISKDIKNIESDTKEKLLAVIARKVISVITTIAPIITETAGNTNTELKDEREEFVNAIKKELDKITINISHIVTHWEEQVNYLEALEVNIDKLEKGQSSLNMFKTKAISKDANEIKEKALKYNRIMNYQVD